MEMNIWDVLRSPVVTEKSVLLKEASSGEGDKQILTFKVSKDAAKDDIKRAIEEIFNVKVSHVRTVHYDGKLKRRGRTEGRRPSYKKAYVTIKAGEPFVDYGEAI
jgi:large subunit ribosomal protein L23